MKFNKLLYRIFFLVAFCSGDLYLDAQTVSIQTDRNQILIGERVQYDLRINLPSTGYGINFTLPDSIPHFEAIERGTLDTVDTYASFSLHQRIIFTSFDSGSWYIPSFPVTIEINNSFKKFFTDSVLVNVGYAPSDSAGLRDIKPIMEMHDTDYSLYYIIAAILAGLIIIILLYSYFKKREKKPLPALHSALSAYDEAMNGLKELTRYNLTQPPEVKQYHIQLGMILKRYYSRTIQNNLLHETTGTFLLKLKEYLPDANLTSSVAGPLRIADAVKFARYIPPVEESQACLINLKQAIEIIEKNKHIKK